MIAENRYTGPMSRAAVLLFLALGSCSSHQYFRPREVVLVRSPGGVPATQYALGEAGNRVGRLNVWSRGAWREDRDEGSRTVIHLGLEIANTSQGTLFIEVDEVRLHSISGEGRQIDALARVYRATTWRGSDRAASRARWAS